MKRDGERALVGIHADCLAPLHGHGDTYRDVPYVRGEVESLARQLAAIPAVSSPTSGETGKGTP